MAVKKPNIHDFTGSVSVQGDITPITRQPVDKVDAGNWSKMSISELHRQREILLSRYYKAMGAGLVGGAGTIESGIRTIDALLEEMGGEPIGFV